MKILLVEDDKYIAQALTDILANQNYVVDVAADGQLGWELAQAFAYDLILLDVMLPKLDGISLCQRLRSHNYQMPILLLTGQNSTTDKVMGLDAGADDYLIKPFDLQELLARIRVLLRRSSESLPPILEWENLRLNPSSCEVVYGGKTLNLTPKEYRLLELFLRNSSRVFSRSAIIEHLWSFEELPNEGTVTAHIMGLRQKLKTAGATADFIETVYGLGYRLKVSGNESVNPSLPSAKTKKQRTSEKTQGAIVKVWEQFKDQIGDRVLVIEQAVIALRENTFGDELRQQARQEAHKLAGGLGMFGFAEGSQRAAEIEQLLLPKVILEQTQTLRLSKLVVALRLELENAPNHNKPHSNIATDFVKDKGVGEPENKEETLYQQPFQAVSNHDNSLVLMIDDDAELAEQIKTEAVYWGVQVEVATNLPIAKDMIERKPPDAVLLDLATHGADSLTLLAELTNQTPSIPVLILTARDSFKDRVEVARLGGRGFLQKPVPPNQVLEAITQILEQVHNRESKVMVVDDDQAVLAVLKGLLEPWGIKLITLDNPLYFWNVLEETSPDLLILDVEMPHLSGIDLCRVVRNELRWSDLPIIFLTAHTNADIIQRVFVAGADDYVSKPIIGPELISRVISRVERMRFAHASLTRLQKKYWSPQISQVKQ